MYLYRLYTNIYTIIHTMSYKHKKCYTNYIIDYNYSIIQYLILHVTTVTSLHRNNTHTQITQFTTVLHIYTLLMK